MLDFLIGLSFEFLWFG